MKFIYISVIAFHLTSCISNYFEQSYRQQLSLWEDSLVSHFPDKFGEGKSLYPILTNPPEENSFYYTSFFYMNEYQPEDYAQLHARVDSMTKKVYGMEEPSLRLFIYLDSLEVADSKLPIKENPYVKELAARNFTLEDELPVPWFSGSSFYNGVDILDWYDPNFKLYVIDARPGVYLPEGKLYDSSGCLPEKWRHGYSRGVALNDKTREAIFWIVAW